MPNNVSVLIVAQPGRKRESLRVLLRGIAGLEIIGEMDDIDSAWTLITEHSPPEFSSFVTLIDFTSPDSETWDLLTRIKTGYPQIRCLALVSDSEQEETVRNAGADEVLLFGFSLETLQASLGQTGELPDDMLDAVAGGTGQDPTTWEMLIKGNFNLPFEDD